jgi:hypothetical protein
MTKITKERRTIFVKNNVLMKGILVLIVIALLAMGFTGCGATYIAYPATGTVYVITDSWDDIFLLFFFVFSDI